MAIVPVWVATVRDRGVRGGQIDHMSETHARTGSNPVHSIEHERYAATERVQGKDIMNTKDRIREALMEIMSASEAYACEIQKNWSSTTKKTGWHYRPFGRQDIYLGSNLKEAIEAIAITKEQRKFMK